jgi:nitrate reductase NapE
VNPNACHFCRPWAAAIELDADQGGKTAPHLSSAHAFDIALHCISPRSYTLNDNNQASTKAQEFRGFLLLTTVLAPILTGVIVTGYGFLVWMYQLVAGPPGS